MTVLDGANAFLQQAHRNNWQHYLDALRPGTHGAWDACVLTAGDERQAAMYRRQLEWRQDGGLLPLGTRFIVLPDPTPRRLGSGGATLAALAHIRAEYPSAQRVLIVHSGGDSKRLPHCSAMGKLFARIPRTLPDGRASTVFDEFLISLSGLAAGTPPGVLIASGDVMLVFDHLQLSLRRDGVTGVAAAAPAEMGTRHGVYVSGRGSPEVQAYLHKPSPAALAQWHAADTAGMVQIDTGLVWLAAPTVGELLALATQPAVATAHLNLYGDLLSPLAESTRYDAYLADTSDGPATPEIQAARKIVWTRLRGHARLSVERLQPAVFLHFGSSREYWQMVAANRDLAALCGWTAGTASWPRSTGEPEQDIVAINSLLAVNAGETSATGANVRPALVADSLLAGPLIHQGAAIVSGVHAAAGLALAAAVALSQAPVGDGWLTEVFGLHDDPKQGWDAPSATFMNRPWREWLGAAGVTADILWPDLPTAGRTLWNAALFPLSGDREASLRLALPLQNPSQAPAGWQAAWQAAPRLSMAQAAAQAQGERLLDDIRGIEDRIAATAFVAELDAERPAATAATLLNATTGPALARRSALVASWLAEAEPIRQLRGYRGLAVATGDPAWDDQAFVALATLMGAGGRPRSGCSPTAARLPAGDPSPVGEETVTVRAAARIDLGGGWTDTPPYSIERGGTVLNAAITLAHAYPVIAEGAWLPEPALVLESRDLSATLTPNCAGEVLSYADPADPFALHKAALVLRGIVSLDADPATPLYRLLSPLGGGLRLSTATIVPRGSGLGVSSILAGTVLGCVDRLLAGRVKDEATPVHAGVPLAGADFFADVLLLEQMITTGGGWQDQAGGLTGGIKLVTSAPGLPQQIQVTPLGLSSATAVELAGRLALVYTGQQRLAKNILRAVMGRWMARDPEMTWLLGQIGQLAQAMSAALLAGDVSGLGILVAEHWNLNKRLDPGCTNPFIDGLFDVMAPYISGAKLAGAGGGGFAIVITHTPEARACLAQALADRYPGTPVAVWPCAIATQGMIG